MVKKDDIAVQEKATALMNEGRFAEAEGLLADALREHDDVVIRNNLGVTALEQGEAERCLAVLDPCLNPDRIDLLPNPYTYALASRALTLLGRREEAYQSLELAEAVFADGLDAFRAGGVDGEDVHAWKEYTVAMMKAAAELGDYRLVLDLYGRWEKEHVAWENIYLAAVAAYNLKMFKRAAAYWKVAAGKWKATLLFERVAKLVEQEVVPHFYLNFKLRGWEDVGRILERVNSNLPYFGTAMEDTGFRMFMLAMAFDPQADEQIAGEIMEKMVCQGEAWGEELGRRMLKANSVAFPLKMAAARGLVEKGVFSRDEPIPVIIEGKEDHVRLQKLPVAEEADQETYAAMQKARQLREEGRLAEAIEVLQEIIFKDNFFPPVALNLSSLLYMTDRVDEAEKYLRMAEDIIPENGMVCFNLALILMKQRRYEEAEEYLRRIGENDDEDPELQEKAGQLLEQLTELYQHDPYDQVSAMVTRYAEIQRQKIEEKPLNQAANLARCLKNMPAEWLTGLCNSLEINPAPRRGEREKQCRQALLKPERLSFLLKEYVEGNERELLRYLLQNDGWARLSTVSRKFGSMKGDGYYWEAELPNSPLGVLWALGLAAVGKTKLEKRHEKIVTVPLELRQPLAELLKIK